MHIHVLRTQECHSAATQNQTNSNQNAAQAKEAHPKVTDVTQQPQAHWFSREPVV
jgi:hypothetical protein